MKCRIFCVYVLFLFFLASCSGGLLDSLSRVIDDPVIEKPAAVSFEKETGIRIEWEYDPGADEYVLYRAVDTAVPSYGSIYRGRNLSYEDTEAETGNRYLYYLVKVRGNELFGPSDAVLGVVSGVVLDEYEDNGSKDKSTLLTWDLQSNLYYYQSYGDEKIEDLDWYRVEVPPRRKALVVVTQSGISTGDSAWITFYLEGNTPFTVTNGSAVEIPNYTYDTKMFYFRISPRPSGFVSDLTKGGGQFINYTVSLNQITGL